VIERYHLVLAAVAWAAGLCLALVDQRVPAWSRRVIAVAGVLAAVLGAWGVPRGWPWLVVAVALVVPADDPSRVHPLGGWALPLTVVALVGVWAAVPDTEAPLASAAVLVPLAVLRPARGAAVGPPATAALVVVLTGAVWVGSAGRAAALCAMCAVGLIALAPVVCGFGRALQGRALGELVVAQATVSLVVPRLVMERSVATAVAVALGVTLVLVAWCRWRRPPTVPATPA
jgi:hypothetical protein